MKITKSKKLWTQFIFIATLITVGFGNIQVIAADIGYEGCPSNVLEMITIRNNFRNLLREVEWSVLKFLANVIDYFDTAVKSILKLNLFDYLSKDFKFSSMQTVVIAVMSIALVIGACALVVFHEKIHVSEFLMSILVSMILLIAFPTFISSCNSLKSRGVKEAQSVEIDDKSASTDVDEDGIVSLSTLGSDLLGKGIFDVYNSVENKEKMSYTKVEGSSVTVKNININATITPVSTEPWTEYYITDINDSLPTQYKYSELTTENMMELLGLSSEYNILEKTQDKFIMESSYGANMQVGCSIYTSKAYPSGCVLSDDDYELFVSSSIGSASPYGVKIGDLVYSDGSRITYASSFETYVKDMIANCPAVMSAGKTQAVGANSRTVEEALEIIKDDVIRQLNIEANTKKVRNEKNITTEYKAQELYTEDDYDEMDNWSQFQQMISGYYNDSLYWYSIDFWETFILLVAVALCLIFAGVKIATTLFEIMFNQILTPFIIASDLNNSGRSKKAIQNMLLANIILVIVVLLIRMYIAIIWGVKDSEYGDNFAVMLIVIIAGAKFVVDGPEILTKLFGIDAGVKSGAATMMSINQTAQMGSYAAMGVSRLGGSVIHTATKTGAGIGAGAIKGTVGGFRAGASGQTTLPGKVGYGIGGSAVGGVTGAVGGAFGHTNAGVNASEFTAGIISGNKMSNSSGTAFSSDSNSTNTSSNNTSSNGENNMSSNAGNSTQSSSNNQTQSNSNNGNTSGGNTSNSNTQTTGAGKGFDTSNNSTSTHNNTNANSSPVSSNLNAQTSSINTSGNSANQMQTSAEKGVGFNNSTSAQSNSNNAVNSSNLSGNAKGLDGKDGKDGTNGIQGERGIQGKEGMNGDNGKATQDNQKGKGFNKE